ncbi:multicopper oxidase domain-containing protein [Bianquea renquensis]|uniref:Multicopper oxidase domain-containing protein n=1 Tax=Bianquea renquensis TaxID=2763661 RepID=A0A926I0J0_9FIRM|nr:multicopper oxidase domain-containing protein [Bianquea renquensis]MBC8541986.1 multicopper oxidase domain-containing protein [Bianquea renquensis]
MIAETDCPTPRPIRTFDIEAISLPIVYNKYGDHDPNGLMYVLKEDSQRIQKKARENFALSPPQPYEEVQPLVIRANVGDEIRINFYNRLNRKASIHVQGLAYDVKTSDGANVGFNPDSTTDNFIQYTWYADREGVYLFSDMGDTLGNEVGTNVHGLFGAMIIEEAQSTWYDPVTGAPLTSGVFADIYHPVKPAFREYAIFFHDELEINTKDGVPPIDPHTGMPNGTTAISYRAEPMRNRLPLVPPPEEHVVTGEDISMSSWAYGDPAPFIPKAYVGDPAKFRLIHGGVKETHVFHLHNHQWRLDPNDPQSIIIDSISISPQECFTLDILYGAGSLNGMVGDAIFHCHLYPHFHEGMWTLWRIFDRLEDGTGQYPDHTPIQKLLPLADRVPPPQKDLQHPGYPNFINGQFGQRPSQPPFGILTSEGDNKITPTPLEEANFVPDFAPGALYTETCPCDTDESIKVFELAAVQADIRYNEYGWHDPQGRFFVLKEEIAQYGTLDVYLEKIAEGEIRPEPLVIRANAGDCIEIRMTNLLPEFIEASAFQLKTLTDIVGYHIHLVKFDTIVSDGSANGWNNIAGARQYETLIERFYANEELNTVFFHDHLFANSHQQHGMFGALLIEPAGASFLDPKTGQPLKKGTKAVIKTKTGGYYREFALFVHDFALLFDKDNQPLNPPEHPGSDDDPGVMGVNYRAEPMRERLKIQEDPSHIFSSIVYGDPATPVLETYPGDPMVIRLLDGAHEEQHAFNIAGMSWRKEITNPRAPLAQEQTIGISEAFNIRIDEAYGAGDYLYYYGGIDDLWLGLWGIIRAYRQIQDHLLPLCPDKKIMVPPTTPPKDARVRHFEIAAIQKQLLYNRHGDHDPEGLLFVPLAQAQDVLSGRRDPCPLILRANAGDWIEITLHNLFDPNIPIRHNEYPSVPLEFPHTPSNRVSMNPQFLRCDPVRSSGLNVGYNAIEQTVAPGQSIQYLWHADKEYGPCLINSFGDLRNHRHHGLFGAIIIEPPGARYFCGMRPRDENHGDQAVIAAPGIDSFREFVLFAQNGIRLLDAAGNLIKTAEQGDPDGHGAPDHEDTGEKGYNYRSERFFNRLQRVPSIDKIFDSAIHGDPATPILQAYTNEHVIIRLLMPGDKPRNISFVLHGHRWQVYPNLPSRSVTIQGAISVGGVYTIDLSDTTPCPGDYLYRSGSLRWDVESGMWGILRVIRRSIRCRCECLCQKTVQWWEKLFTER